MDNRTINDHYAEIAEDLIATEPALEYIRNSNARIVYLSSEHKKTGNGKKTFAECEKISEKYKWGIPCDFTITVFEPNVELFSEQQLQILLYHELLHVGIELREDGTERYFINPHDLEDFKLIIDSYGTEWDKTE